MQPDFVSSLVPLRDQQLARGDIVYESVRWGDGDGQAKLNRLRVLRVDRAAAFCEYFDRRRKPRLIPFHQLRMEDKRPSQLPPMPPATGPQPVRMRLVLPHSQEPEPEPKAAPAPKRAHTSDLEAWLEMGRGLDFGSIAAERAELETQLCNVQDELEEVDREHHERIHALEAELQAAKSAHQEARRYQASRQQHIRERLGKINALEVLGRALAGP